MFIFTILFSKFINFDVTAH